MTSAAAATLRDFGSAASLWDEREARHVHRAVLHATLHEDPSPYVYAENVFSEAAYAAIQRLFPAETAFLRWRTPDHELPHFANFERRRQIHLPRDADGLPEVQRDFWSALASFLCAPAFARTLLERFPAFSRARFGEQLDDPSFIEERMTGSVILFEHDSGYYLGPHTDSPEKLFTVLLYFAEREGLDHLGTALYRPLDPAFTCDASLHHDPARFERGRTVPYRPNSAFIFARTNVIFHGVDALTADGLAQSRRRGIQLSFWLRNDRPRSACKTRIDAAIPPAMRSATESVVTYRLTNRADSALFSSHPKTTKIGYRWIDRDGAITAANTQPLPAPLAAGESVQAQLRIVAPAVPGRQLLRVSVLQDEVAWFDDVDPANGSAELVTVWDGASASGASDIVVESDEIALGSRWEPVEREDDRVFRWVDNDAVVHVAALRPVHRALCALVEPGPGMGSRPLTLTARLTDGAELGSVSVAARALVRFALPPHVPAAHSVVLHAEGGGQTCAGDSRVLNFRVFELFVERFADVFPAWAKPARGFYPLERFGGSMFRWACGEASVELGPRHEQTLSFGIEPGPGVDSRAFVLRVSAPDGTELLSMEIPGRTVVAVPLAGLNDAKALTLQALGGGRAVPGDPRTLDFRIFALT